MSAPEEVLLSNGIPVILQHYDGPVAATYWWNRVGSADENPAEAGFAHFLEHMLFKDAAAKETGRPSSGQMARAIESLGGDINAYTSFDQTVYHVTCAAHHWERVIDAFGAIAKPQRFLKTDFEREREVILEELRKNEDSPGRQLFQTLFSETFRKHPYGKPVIGYTRTLKAAKVGTLEAFYRRNYVPGKMGLILVGPIADAKGARRKALLSLLEKRFGSRVLPKRPVSFRSRIVEPPTRKGLPPVKALGFDVKTPTFSVAFRVPDLKHEDLASLDLVAGILGMGELGRLYQRLFYQTSLATEASGGMYVPLDPGMAYFQAETDSVAKVQRVAEEMFREIRRIREEGPTPEELSRVLVNAESEKLYATQSADGMAGRLGFLRFVVGDLDFDRKYLDRLHAIDASRVREAASAYLVPERMSGAILVPKGEASVVDTAAVSRLAMDILSHDTAVTGAMARSASKKPVRKGLVPEIIQLPSGIRVVYFERPQSHVFSMHASVLGGLRLELTDPVESKDSDWGSSHMMAQSWTKGSVSRDARAIAATVEGHASSMDGYSGRNTVGLQLTGLARDWGELSRLFGESLLHPTFPEDEVDHSRRVVEDSIRGIEDHSSQLCSKLFLETLFEKHPYGRLTTGSLESVQTIRSAKLQAFHRKWMRPERLVLSLSGAVKRPVLELWLEELEEAARKLPPPQAGAGVGGDRLRELLQDEPPLKGPRWVEKPLGREQTHILVGGLGSTLTSDDRFAIRLMQTLLGGQSGRLFIELREKKSLAYTVSPVSFEGMERGYIGTYIACAPAKRDEAISGIRSVLEKLAEKGPTAAEMTRAKEFFLGRRAMDLQGDSSLAAHFGLETLYGVPILEDEALVKRIRSVTAKDISETCRKYLIEPHMVTSVVG